MVREIWERGSEGDLPEVLKAMLTYAEKLTLSPGGMEEADLREMQAAGLDDRAILEVVEVTAYFNLVNRIADGLGVTLEGPEEA